MFKTLKMSSVLKLFFGITLTSYYIFIGFIYQNFEKHLSENVKVFLLISVFTIGALLLLGSAYRIIKEENTK